jgi:hypothetical protein
MKLAAIKVADMKAALLNSYRIQFNAVTAINPSHRGIEGVYKRGMPIKK